MAYSQKVKNLISWGGVGGGWGIRCCGQVLIRAGEIKKNKWGTLIRDPRVIPYTSFVRINGCKFYSFKFKKDSKYF